MRFSDSNKDSKEYDYCQWTKTAFEFGAIRQQSVLRDNISMHQVGSQALESAS